MVFSLSLHCSCLFFSLQTSVRERDMRDENENIIISKEGHKCDGETKGSTKKRTTEQEGIRQQNMNMKEVVLCPFCLHCCVINLQIFLTSISRCNPFCC